ncbi:663_t:CDS:2 [Dentiscutata heterogama]|uniref:663_t:CDS:1 n=1 Tax=Dentiscutata heterogama TaxID=1316150 RepID=A0ACA9KRV7_9GLOM|nr:663_t:CDS:2 [Dentiscutata heterogama]
MVEQETASIDDLLPAWPLKERNAKNDTLETEKITVCETGESKIKIDATYEIDDTI